jgi:putative phosphoribosyl transferase
MRDQPPGALLHFFPALGLFKDRVDAGARLGDALAAYRDASALVLGIPRGGVPVAAEVARRLGAELDVVVARKIGAPFQPELALGAVTSDSSQFLNEELLRQIAITAQNLAPDILRERAEAQRREVRFRGSRPAPVVRARVVILVDDGLATGATMRAAVRSVQAARPAHLVVAVPVGSREACAALRQEVDEVVCLAQPEPFYAVGMHYQRFEATRDAEVAALLQEGWARRPSVIGSS